MTEEDASTVSDVQFLEEIMALNEELDKVGQKDHFAIKKKAEGLVITLELKIMNDFILHRCSASTS